MARPLGLCGSFRDARSHGNCHLGMFNADISSLYNFFLRLICSADLSSSVMAAIHIFSLHLRIRTGKKEAMKSWTFLAKENTEPVA